MTVRGRAAGLKPLSGAMGAPAIINLNTPAHNVHWHFFQMSVANIVVILLMIVVFILAILIPFPKREIEE